MSNKKQTSVDLLRDKLFNDFGFAFSDNVFQQAQELHRQEIMDAYVNGVDIPELAEQYYKENYETND